MLETYKAILHGDKIEWETDAPTILEKENSVAVYVTIIDKVGITDAPNGEKMAKVLKELAAKGGISAIENASQWQREQRQDRNFVGREKQKLRPFGLCKNEFTVPENFDTPLPEEILASF